MKSTWKKFFSRALPVFLAAVFMMVFSTAAYAKSDKSGQNSGKPDWVGEKQNNGNANRDSKNEKANEKVKKTYRGISVEKIALAIESVTDEATRSSLTALLEAYMTALSDKDAALTGGGLSMSELSQAASAARSALKQGLEDAGFTLGSVLGWQEWKVYGNETLDLSGIALVIAALDDTDANKAALTSLLSAYETALAALNTAGEDNEDVLKEAADQAREALLEALYASGLYPLAEPEVTPLPEATPEPASPAI